MSATSEEMRLRALLEQTIATGNAAISERDRLRVVVADLRNALDQVSMHASAKFTDDDAVMESWIRVVDLANATLKATQKVTS